MAARGRGGGSGAQDRAHDPAKLFAEQGRLYQVFNNQVGTTLAAVSTLSESISNSDTFDGDKKAALEKMLAVTERLVRLTAEGEARGEACSAIREAINNEVRQGTDPVNEPEEYGRRVAAASRRWKGANPSAVRENRLVKEARELVAKADEGDDDVLMETGGAGVAKCPLMGDSNFSAHGGALVNRGRGAKTFEQIDPTISRPCPQAGCSHQVRKVGLSKDFRAENSQRRAARRAATQTSGEDGEDLDDDDDGVEEL